MGTRVARSRRFSVSVTRHASCATGRAQPGPGCASQDTQAFLRSKNSSVQEFSGILSIFRDRMKQPRAPARGSLERFLNLNPRGGCRLLSKTSAGAPPGELRHLESCAGGGQGTVSTGPIQLNRRGKEKKGEWDP